MKSSLNIVSETLKNVHLHLVLDSDEDYPPACRRRRAAFFRLLACLTCLLNPAFGLVALYTVSRTAEHGDVPRRGKLLWCLFMWSMSTTVLASAILVSLGLGGGPSSESAAKLSSALWLSGKRCAGDRVERESACTKAVAAYWSRHVKPRSASAPTAVNVGAEPVMLLLLSNKCADVEARLALHSLGAVCALLQFPPSENGAVSGEHHASSAAEALWFESGRMCRLWNGGSFEGVSEPVRTELRLWADAASLRCNGSAGLLAVTGHLRRVACPRLKYAGDLDCLSAQGAKVEA